MAGIFKFASKDDLSEAVGDHVLRVTQEAAEKDKFLVALSGGSLPKLLAAGLLKHQDEIDFSKWHVFFADERHVPHDHEDSNMLACKNEFLAKIPGIKEDQVYGIDYSVPVEEAAQRYQVAIEAVTGVSAASGAPPPSFDLVLLGMGPDGHTCSLFPGHELLKETEHWVAPIKDSPKPPSERITLTYPVLNVAANVFFLAAGKSKEDVLPLTAGLTAEGLNELGEAALPAARVRPVSGKLAWFVDEEAAAKL
ncbi:6-phosphogluconolactonase [Hondaea fermentalgiana]|uniref:6-phosphogluconolactonase n=1 Tax=Hondaea fermentalgiana TaxID=2315210 RepID=A0A2R5GG76_9STRA|nr:6-phosphogluconolactonase [Hondaea fermentalgiana]|eukprot:GBG27251.1 6-phosphogluconolactonase [Hondaea fermentalgiana]